MTRHIETTETAIGFSAAASSKTRTHPNERGGARSHMLRFCKTWLVACAVMLMLVGAFDAAVDPFLVIGAPRLSGVNRVKPETETHAQLAKDYLLSRSRPAGVMIGDSKVDIGLDPESQAWPDDARPVFNYGVPGVGLQGELDNLRRAVARGSVRRVLVVVEIEELMKPPHGPGSTQSIVGAPSLPAFGPAGQRLSDILLSTLSLDALRASVTTVFAQYQTDAVDMSPYGATGDGGFKLETAREGEDALFVQKDADAGKRRARLKTGLLAQSGPGFGRVDLIVDMISLCRTNGIGLDLAIAPLHADALEGFDKDGLWPRYRSAKLALARLVDEEGGGAARLWDFAGYDAYSTEIVPGSGDKRTATRWFWEPSHFKHALGERLLQTVYRGSTGFGWRVSAADLAAHAAEEESAKGDYHASGKSLDRLVRAAPG